MLKLMIVDDECIVRQGIRRGLPWDEMDVRCVGEADNISGAIETARDVFPDIVLCDIRMPGGEGFLLVDEIRRIVPWVQFIMITAYSDREYMRYAIQLEICDYLFKPANVEDIRRAVERAYGKVLEYQEKRKKDLDYKNFIFEHMESLRENLISGILHGHIKKEKALQDAKQLKLDLGGPTYRLIFIWITPKTWNSVMQQMAGCLEKYHASVVQVNAELLVLTAILNCGDQEGENEIRSSMRMIDSKEIWLSAQCRELEGLAREYRNIQERLGQKEEGTVTVPMLDGELMRLKETIFEAVKYHDSAGEIIRLFDQFLEQSARRNVPKAELNLECRNIISTVRVLTGITRRDSNIPENEKEARSQLTKLCMEIKDNRKYPLDEVSGRARYYIKKHYTEDLTVEQIAAELFMSSSYLSRIIKERTGHGFGYWLNYYRVEAAKEKLRDPAKNIEQVAEECGYNSYRIFSENFRKYTGKTASVWRTEK